MNQISWIELKLELISQINIELGYNADMNFINNIPKLVLGD